MIVTFFKGVLLGFSMSLVFIGPSFFALIQASIKKGFRSAAAMAFGISLSDIFCVLLAYLGAEQFLDNPKVKIYEGIGGSIILFIFGIVALFQKHEDEKDEQKALEVVSNNKRLHLMLLKGFFLNILNPFVLLMWIAWVGFVSSKYSHRADILSFFAGTLGMILFSDLLKSLAANRLKRILTHNLMKMIHYIMAIALIICGIVLLYDVFSGKSVSA